MDIATYLRRQKEHVGAQTRRIRDPTVFDFDYVPEQPLLRSEAETLVQELLRFDLTGIPTHCTVIGSRGSGKTLTVKLLQRIVPQETRLKVHYANCRAFNTSFKILAHFLNVNARGASLTELFERFSAGCTTRTVVILDEIDLMSPKDRQREILYLLSRSNRPFMILMLSNSPRVMRELDAATRSSLQAVPLHFRNYDAEQIRLILEDRARRGLHEWEESALAQIAALTVRRTNADARVAIKTLYYHVTSPEQNLETSFERARRDIVIDLINDLSDATLMILWAVATARSEFAKDVYRRYCQFCLERSEKAFSYMHFGSSLSYLQSMGLIGLASTKVGRTYTNRVLLTFDEPIVEQICRLRFER